ncbi:MAG TPA: segregation/condensation protein A [Nitrospirae bacterium]|nr:segregation/condensation protein A [Nitrospirota bacterium]HDO67219.1 segregation/condensation protein A [Nitrospirota bacterium]HDZ84667.1 segregation/condensation protein A [Nitrospirota bacterium]HEW81393.1 segregation/condensation protein A [Nitrospirota bacterium]
MEKPGLKPVELKKKKEAPKKDFWKEAGPLSAVHFKLPVFEGPLDLLLHLIKSSKIDIYDIPILDITRQYLDYIDIMKELNLEIAGDFLVMAATLIHVKSRMLLPPSEEESDELAEDPRSELVKRLLEYEAYKETSSHLRKREDIWKNVFHRGLPDIDSFEFEADPVLFEASVFDLISAFQKLLEKAPAEVREISREKLTVAERINYIVERLDKEDGIKFEDLFEKGYTKGTILVTFLAMLEIVRLGLVKIYQEKAFESIWLLKRREEDIVDLQQEEEVA